MYKKIRSKQPQASLMSSILLGTMLLAGQVSATTPNATVSAAETDKRVIQYDFRKGTSSGKTLNFDVEGVKVEISGGSTRMATKPDRGTSAIRTVSGLGIGSISDWDTFGLGVTTVNWSFTGPGETLFLTFDRPVSVEQIRLGGQQLAQIFPTTTTVMYAVDPETNKRIGPVQSMNNWFNRPDMKNFGEYQFDMSGKLPVSTRFAVTGVLGIDHLDTMTIVQIIFVIPKCPGDCVQLSIEKGSTTKGGSVDPVVPTSATNVASAATGSQRTYTLTVRNWGKSTSKGLITVKDLLPNGMSPVQPNFVSNGWNCTTSGQLLTCTSNQTIAPNTSSKIEFDVNLAAGLIGTLKNKASVGGGGDPDPLPNPETCVPGTVNPGNQCAEDTITIKEKQKPQLVIEKAASTGPWKNGGIKVIPISTDSTEIQGTATDTPYYTLTVKNVGQVSTSGTITVRDLLPAGVSPVNTQFREGIWSCATTVTSTSGRKLLTCTTTSVLSANGSSAIKLPVKLDSTLSGAITNKATVSGGGDTDPAPDPATCVATQNDQCAEAVIEVKQVQLEKPQLAITKISNGPWSLATDANQTPEYTLTVRNTSLSATKGIITVKDLLPRGVTPVNTSFTSGDWACNTSIQTVTCTNSNGIAAGSSSNITIPVKLSSALPEKIVNKAIVFGGGDPEVPDLTTCQSGTANPANQCAEHSTEITDRPTPPIRRADTVGDLGNDVNLKKNQPSMNYKLQITLVT